MGGVQTFLNQPVSIFRYPMEHHPSYEKLTLTPSLYTQWNEGQTCRKLDQVIRKSYEIEIYDQILSDKANKTLTDMMANINEKLAITDDKWRLFKYQNGHFVQHIDYQRKKDPLVHFGTQIWLPPKSICAYQGGVLKTKAKEVKEISPSETEWTLIVLPLGVIHEISQVKGTRISYVKPIYIYARQKQYSIPKPRNYENKFPKKMLLD